MPQRVCLFVIFYIFQVLRNEVRFPGENLADDGVV